MTKTLVRTGAGIVRKLRKTFPQVRTVRDASRSALISIDKRDTSRATRLDHFGCVMAEACKRQQKLDGVVISISTAYLIKKRVAIRYLVPTAVQREIVSFDRGTGFAPGQYVLVPFEEGRRLGSLKKASTPDGTRKRRLSRHQTFGIRAII